MKKLYSPLLFLIIMLTIWNVINLIGYFWHIEDVKQQEQLQIATFNNELYSQQEEIKRLSETVNKQNKTIKEKDDKIKEYIKKIDIYIDEIERISTIRARVTAYSPLDDVNGINSEGNPRVTSRGTLARRGVIAVDPSKIPYDTELHIPGYGNAVAEDTGGAIRNYTEGIAIDVCVDTYEEAIAWGVRYLDVKIK